MRRSHALAFLAGTLTLAGCTHGSTEALPLVSGGNALLSSTTTSCLTSTRIYVSTYDGPNNAYAGQIYLYSIEADGNAHPVEHLKGKSTHLAFPMGIAVGSDRTIYAANFRTNTVNAYAPGDYGRHRPKCTLSGLVTQLNTPSGIAVDGAGRAYVVNQGGTHPGETVFPSGAKNNHAPSQWIRGAKTGFHIPISIAIDGNDNIYVGDIGNDTISVSKAGAKGDVYPIRTIAGKQTQIECAFGLAVDTGNNLYVTNCSSGSQSLGSIGIFAPGANGNAKPIALIEGPDTGLDGPRGIAFDADQNIYVTNDNGDSSVTVYKAGSNGDVTPTRTIQGSKTQLQGSQAAGLAIR